MEFKLFLTIMVAMYFIVKAILWFSTTKLGNKVPGLKEEIESMLEDLADLDNMGRH